MYLGPRCLFGGVLSSDDHPSLHSCFIPYCNGSLGDVCPELLDAAAAAAVSIRMPRAAMCAAALPSYVSETRGSVVEVTPCSTRGYS